MQHRKYHWPITGNDQSRRQQSVVCRNYRRNTKIVCVFVKIKNKANSRPDEVNNLRKFVVWWMWEGNTRVEQLEEQAGGRGGREKLKETGYRWCDMLLFIPYLVLGLHEEVCIVHQDLCSQYKTAEQCSAQCSLRWSQTREQKTVCISYTHS
jgi:hypothetical protein